MTFRLLSTIVLFLYALNTEALAGGEVTVQNGGNAGVGSLRSALLSGASNISIPPSVGTIYITEPLLYNQEQALKLLGSGQTIDASSLHSNADILTITSGADLLVSRLNVVGNVVKSTQRLGEANFGKGIYVHVPKTEVGIVSVTLDHLTLSGVGGHGVHVSDCSLGDECGGGNSADGDGSAASLHLKLNEVVIRRVGFGKQDADGVRVDERGIGDIHFSATKSRFLNVGADGVELDEGNDGDVVVEVIASLFDGNGEYCATIEFVEGSPCDDGGESDLDDGFDIDEAGNGSLYATIRDTTVSHNLDEGLDFDEDGDGSLVMRLDKVFATLNRDEGVKASENGRGSLIATLRAISTIGNNGSKEEVELEEGGDGNMDVQAVDSVLGRGGEKSLKLEQRGRGQGNVNIRESRTGTIDLEGVLEI